MKIGGKIFSSRKTYIMGILNVTPDSFSDGGKFLDPDDALRHAEEMVRDGADIIDVGGESTRPGFTPVSESEEADRTSEVIERITSSFDIPVSIDTYKAAVAKSALEAGASMINDIWGLREEFEDIPDVPCRQEISALVKDNDAAICLMHNSRTEYPERHQEENYISRIKKELSYNLSLAKRAGIEENRIILDPGVGFGKTQEENVLILKEMEAFSHMGFPMLLGASRKSVIRNILGGEEESLFNGTLFTTALAAAAGFCFVRVHDIKGNKDMISMVQEICHGKS